MKVWMRDESTPYLEFVLRTEAKHVLGLIAKQLSGSKQMRRTSMD
jgi:hypothetical protein